jgi:hypothetical protein
MNVLNYIESRRQFYETQTIEVPGDEEYSQADLILAVNKTRLSKYSDGNATDDIIGDFPYDNISKFRIRLEARATDFDTSHIQIEPLNGSREARVSAMIATKALGKKMRKTRFGNTLNKICDTLPEYGGVLVKKTADGVHVVPWENVITDFSNIMGGVIIERHYLLPSELKKKGWKNVDELIRSAAQAVKESSLKKGDGDDVDTITSLIEIWELHGEITKAMYKIAIAGMNDEDYDLEENDDLDFVTAQVITAPLGVDEEGNMQGMYLQVNEEGPIEDTYRYKARNPLPGRGLGQGIPEELGEHQRWHNFYKTEEARAVAVGGKVLFVTDDGNVVDSVYDEGIDHGTIMKVGEGKMFQQLSTIPSAVPLYRSSMEDWSISGDKLTNSFAVALGSQEFSDTPFKAQYLQDINSNSQFKQYYEEISEELVQPIVEDWLLPDALKEAAEENELYETFSKAELQLIDEVIVEKALAERGASILLNEQRPVLPEENVAMRTEIQTELNKTGSKRSVKDIKEFIKREVLGNVIIHTSDERRNKQALFESYSTALGMFAETDPARLAIRDRILDQMGVTKEELSLYVEEAAAMTGMTPPANAQVDAKALTQTDKERAIA